MDYLQLFTAGTAPSSGLQDKQLADAFDELRSANAQLQAQLAGGNSSANTTLHPTSATPGRSGRMARYFDSPKFREPRRANSTAAQSPARPPLVPGQRHTRQFVKSDEKSRSSENGTHPDLDSDFQLMAVPSKASSTLPALPAMVPPHDDTPLAPTAPAASLYQAAQAWRAAAAYSEAKASAACSGAAASAATEAAAVSRADELQAALRAAEDRQSDLKRECQNYEAEARVLRVHLSSLEGSSSESEGDSGDEAAALQDDSAVEHRRTQADQNNSPSPAALAQLHGLLEAAHVEVEALRRELARVRQQREEAAAAAQQAREAQLSAQDERRAKDTQLRQAQAVAFVADEQVRQLREEAAELQRCIAAAGGLSIMQHAQAELQEAQQDAAACRAHNEELLSTLEGVQASLSSLTGAVKASEAAAEQSAQEAEQAQQLREELQAKLTDAQDALAAERQRADEAEQKHSQLQHRIDAMQKAAQADAELITSLKKQLDSVNNELNATLTNHEARMHSLVHRAGHTPQQQRTPSATASPPPRPVSLSPKAAAAAVQEPQPDHKPDVQVPQEVSPSSRASLLRTASPSGADSPGRAASPLAAHRPNTQGGNTMQLTTSVTATSPSTPPSARRMASAASTSPPSPAAAQTPPTTAARPAVPTAFTIESGQAVDPSKAAIMEHKLRRGQGDMGGAEESDDGMQGSAAAAAARSRARARAAAAAAQREVRDGGDGHTRTPVKAAFPPMTPTARVVQDNHKRLRNALSRVLLAAEAHTAPLAHALDAIEANEHTYIVACFVSGHSTVRGRFISLLAMNDDCTVARRIWGKGPRTVTRDMMRTQYKFDTVSRDFVRLTVSDFSFVSDGIGVDAALVKVAGLKAPTISAHMARGDTSTIMGGGTVDLGSDSEVDSQHGMDEMLLM